jgi:hypothetical protein
MNSVPQVKRTPLETLWIGVRFLLFGVGGFLVLWISWISLWLAFDPPADRLFSPLLAFPLCLAGAIMMLFGSGQWGRWAYLWVFLSTPIAISLLYLASKLLERWWPNAAPPDFIDPKLLGIVAFAAPMPITYFLVKSYYRRKDACCTQ